MEGLWSKYLFLTQIVWEIGHHNLSFGRYAVFRRTTLLGGPGGTNRLGIITSSCFGTFGGVWRRVGSIGEGKYIVLIRSAHISIPRSK